MGEKKKATMEEFAINYAKHFHAVIPLGAWTFTGRDGKEVSMWKKPLIKNWQVEPLKTPKQAEKFWSDHIYKYRETPQIGIATGQICGGYIVIDLDRNHIEGIDGYETLLNWQRENGVELPETWTAITGSGGYHLWYRTDKAMRCYSNNDIGVDLRADGGYIVMPPSLHPNGKRYQWELVPGEVECAEADETVMAFINYCRPTNYQYTGRAYSPSERRESCDQTRKMLLPGEILEGGRHSPFISLIGTLNKLGVSDEAIVELIRYENDTKCKPPLSETELQHEIFPAVYRWPKGVSEEKWMDTNEWKKQRSLELMRDRLLGNEPND